MDCLFCKIVKDDLPSYKLYEDDLCIAILDAYPNVDGHTLIIPKKHYTDYTELDEELIIHMNHIAKKLNPFLMKKCEVNSISFIVNYGEAQMIKHFHLHLLPNYGISKKAKYTPKEMYEKIMKNPSE